MTVPRASYTANEIAEMHGVSASLIRKMVARGELARSTNLGNRVRIPYAEVVAKFGPVPDHVLEGLGAASTKDDARRNQPAERSDGDATGCATIGRRPAPDELEDLAQWVAVSGHLCRHDSLVVAEALRRLAAIERSDDSY